MKTLTIMRDPFAPETAERIKNVESVRKEIRDRFDVWPASARIYAGHIAVACDVTPQTPEDVDALEEIEADHIIVVVFPANPVMLLVAVIAVVAVAAAVILFMPQVPSLDNRQFSSATNELSDRQNKPRPNGRIPDIYGRLRAIPDLISLPYKVFIDNQEIEVAYLCLGRGEFDIHDLRDDTTPISTIEGASIEIYGPNTSPNFGFAQMTVGDPIGRDILSSTRITSVNGQVLKPSDWVGPFVVRLRDLDRILVNVIAPQGMFKDDGDVQTSASVDFDVEITPLDNAGLPSGTPVTSSASIAGSATDRDQKGVTVSVAVTAPSGQVSVRMQRTTPLDTVFEGTVVDEIKWRDCYGQAPVDVDHFGDITTIHAQTYATAGALAVKSRKLNMLVTRRLPFRTGDFTFGALYGTPNAADILCAMALDPRIGRMPGGTLVSDGGPGQVDVPNIYQTIVDVQTYFGLEEAGHFAYTFDRDDISFQEMAQSVANAVFCQAYRRGSILRLFFEREQEDSTLLLNHRNKLPGTETRTYAFGPDASNDGIAFTYIDPADDAVQTLYIPQGDDSAINAMKVSGIGIRGFEQAYLHAWRHWNRLRFRYLTEQFDATQEADMLVRFERFLSVDTTRSAVLDGEVLSQDGLVLQTSQAAPLDPLETYLCFLQLPSGLVESIAVTQGADEFHLVLAAPPSEPLTLEGDAAYITGYVVIEDGSNSLAAVPMLVDEKDPSDNGTVGVTAINYDARYYDNDHDFISSDEGTPVEPTEPDVVDGEPDPAVEVSITPPGTSTASNAPSTVAEFTASGIGGAAPPTSYFWGVFSGPGEIFSTADNVAFLRVYDVSPADSPSTAEFFCDMVIDGVTYRAFCTMTHNYEGVTEFPREGGGWQSGGYNLN